MIVLGTGLGESLLAAALAKQGLSVLHLDDQSFYGRHHCVLNGDQILRSSLCDSFVSLNLSLGISLEMSHSERVQDWMEWIRSLTRYQSEALRLKHFSSLDALDALSESNLAQKLSPLSSLVKESRLYNLELAPKLFYARGSLVELMIGSNVGSYVEFRGLENIYILLDQDFEQVSRIIDKSQLSGTWNKRGRFHKRTDIAC